MPGGAGGRMPAPQVPHGMLSLMMAEEACRDLLAGMGGTTATTGREVGEENRGKKQQRGSCRLR